MMAITMIHNDINNMYNQIEALIQKVPQRNHLFIIGEFNSKVGNLHVNYPNAIRKHTAGEYNARGQFLAEFCTRNKFIISNTQKRNNTLGHNQMAKLKTKLTSS